MLPTAAALDAAPIGLRPEALTALRDHMRHGLLYLTGSAAVTRALMLSHVLSVSQSAAARGQAEAQLTQALGALLEMATDFAMVEKEDLWSSVVTVLSAERLRTLHADLVARGVGSSITSRRHPPTAAPRTRVGSGGANYGSNPTCPISALRARTLW